MEILKYEDITKEMLGTRRQRPMYLSKFTKFREELDMKTYPKDPHKYRQVFLNTINDWIKNHKKVNYLNLHKFTRKDAILGTTHTLDELHQLHGKNITVFKGEYKYHRRLTDFSVNEIEHYSQLKQGNVFIASCPSCITTNYLPKFDKLLDHCFDNNIPVHLDGAWFGQCRNFHLDVDHPAIHSISVSLSKAFGMGSQRIGIRYTKERINGPIAIMNDFEYTNVSDMWIGVEMINFFGNDYWWNNYEDLYSKVCKDFSLFESDSIHVGWEFNDNEKRQFGIRTPLRFLIEGIFDERGTDLGLNQIEKTER